MLPAFDTPKFKLRHSRYSTAAAALHIAGFSLQYLSATNICSFRLGGYFDGQELEATRVDASASSHLEDTRKKENTCGKHRGNA
jgi:hypothetical protein